jgi:TolB-like protein
LDHSESNKPKPTGLSHRQSSGLAAFWAELKRRKVMRVAITYAVVAWLIIQVAATTFGSFGIPEWAFRFVVLMVILGFPVALIIAWAFELTPDGIKTTKHAREQQGEALESTTQERKRNWMAFAFAAAVPTLIFGALVLFFYFRSEPQGNLTPDTLVLTPGLTESDKSIAVLPLENMSPDPENAFFADGVHQEILTNLEKVRQLFVIGRTSTLQYRETIKPLKQIGHELGVRYLLEGSVQRAGNQVRVAVQLIDSDTEGQLWAEQYTRDLDDFFTIISAISKEIAGELEAVLSPGEIAEIERPPTKNREAYDYYLHSLQVNRRISIPLLEKAVALDPEFVEAWEQLALDRIVSWRGDKNRNDPDLRDKAYEALNTVSRLDPDSARLIKIKGSFAFNEKDDVEAALESQLKAHEKDPGAAYIDGWRHMQLGRLSEAEFYMKTSLKKDPFVGTQPSRMINLYAYLGKWEDAYTFINKGLDFFAEDVRPTFTFRQREVVVRYLETGNKQDFIASNLAWRRAREEQLPDTSSSGQYVVRDALLQRLFPDALKVLGETEWPGFFTMFEPAEVRSPTGRWRLRIEPMHLLTALIHYESGNKQQWMEETKRAKGYLEDIISADPIADPDY